MSWGGRKLPTWALASGPQDPRGLSPCVTGMSTQVDSIPGSEPPSFRGFSQVSRGVWDQQEESSWGQARIKTPEIGGGPRGSFA